MFFPRFAPPGVPGLWGRSWPVPPFPVPGLPAYRFAPFPRKERQETGSDEVLRPTDQAVPPGVRVVVVLRAARPGVPNLPDSRMAWSPDSRHLLYVAGPGPQGEQGPLMLLDMEQPESPRPVAENPLGGGLAWHSDGQSFVYTAMYRDPERGMLPTIYQKRLDDGEPINLVPPGVTRVAFIHRWLDARTLAFDESAGTGLRRTMLLEVPERRLFENPELMATIFTWSPDGSQLAGQLLILVAPGSTWFWDRSENRFLVTAEPGEPLPIPGEHHFFEAWSPDGRSALLSAWEQERPYQPGARPALYRLDIETSQAVRVAEGAALAAWSGDWIAYVGFGTNLTLTVTRAADNQVLWTDDLGPRPEQGEFPWTYWPRFAGPYVAYRTTAGEWRVSRADRKEVRPIYRGESVELVWSPDGRHIALLHTNESAVITVVANPLTESRGSLPTAMATNAPAPLHQLPPGMTLERALATVGNPVSLTGEGSVAVFIPPMITPQAIAIPHVAVRLKLQGYPYPVFLQASEELAYVDVNALIRAAHQQQIRVTGITQGIDPLLGPVLELTDILSVHPRFA